MGVLQADAGTCVPAHLDRCAHGHAFRARDERLHGRVRRGALPVEHALIRGDARCAGCDDAPVDGTQALVTTPVASLL